MNTYILIGVACNKLVGGKFCVHIKKQPVADIVNINQDNVNYQVHARILTTASTVGLIREIKACGGTGTTCGVYNIDNSEYAKAMTIISNFLNERAADFTFEKVTPSEAPKNISCAL